MSERLFEQEKVTIMKKSVIALVVTITATLLVPVANAEVKAGAICPKVGKTSVASGKTFTCIKSGKKTVWNKGLAIAQPAAAPATSPTTTPAAPSASPEPVAVKIPTTPTSFADLEENFQGIPYAVWEKVQKNLALYRSTDLKISFIFGPTTPQRYPDQWTIDAVTLGSRVMGAQKQPAEVKFVQFNKADVAWARTEAAKYVSPFNLGMSLQDQASDKCANDDCDGAVTNIASDIGLVLVGVSTPVSKWNIQKFLGQNDLHEFTHAVQGMIFKGKVNNPPPTQMPCWYSEGQPQAVSIPTVAKSAEDYIKKRKSWVTDNRWLLKDYEPETIQQFLKENMKVPCPGSTMPMISTLGYIIMDALVSIGGIDKTFDVLTAKAEGLTFEDAFMKVYGISWDQASVALSKAASKVYKEYR